MVFEGAIWRMRGFVVVLVAVVWHTVVCCVVVYCSATAVGCVWEKEGWSFVHIVGIPRRAWPCFLFVYSLSFCLLVYSCRY